MSATPINPQEVTGYILNLTNADYLRQVRDMCIERLNFLGETQQRPLPATLANEKATHAVGERPRKIHPEG